ncbi:phosphate acyltransferase PlsX [Carnobacterium maltaromaticum]|uniref:Phosphate acyltransferase n=1 Tax=Carnobacterium maltaromaticum LMA28 TaxID=1234679 RepID=K8E3L7_CARML|nr:phosphate acyltransferase PlsX [Carnobacterium maltaromaticum]AOA01856.1 phosphate acyltransferase [Carnobacterium maltaromaticum]KRN64699.1 phosphate acyltransferase PlsX [Carnobacterium maltaromaticum DSM 20342]MCI1818604.1 phosphate acyltransferase PlsX [Carnobacterium maltaromaticum]CCO10912.2 fatty acid/phospholipid synthesis protein PlsX [Carnobacterium maltaromaticum LMA28]
MRIAVDAMGGDNAPQAIVEGVMMAAKEFHDVEFILFGKEDAIRTYLTDETNIKIVHTDEKINSDDDPVRAVRRKKNASMILAAQAVKNKEADALFSAGNTGALLTAGLLIIGRIKGIDRPGLMPTLPVVTGANQVFNLMDVGANADTKPENILQYAILASYYAKFVRGVENPSVGLLNNGTEENKGNDVTKRAYALLAAEKEINFIGNVEARELLNGVADVVVTDGFTGNAVLKTIEGTAMSMMKLLKNAVYDSGIKGKLGGALLKGSLSEMKDKLDYSRYGGAVLFGVKAPVVKTHGSTEKESVYFTIRQIHEMLNSHVIDDLVTYFESKAEAEAILVESKKETE